MASGGLFNLVSEKVGQLELSMEGEVNICQSNQIGKGIWVEREAVYFRKPLNFSETFLYIRAHSIRVIRVIAMVFNLYIFAPPCMPDGPLSITWAGLS